MLLKIGTGWNYMKKLYHVIFILMLLVVATISAPAVLLTAKNYETVAQETFDNETYNYSRCYAWGRVVYVENENESAGFYRNVSFNAIYVKCIPIPPQIKFPLIDRYFPFQKFEMDTFRGILRVGYIAGICTNVTI